MTDKVQKIREEVVRMHNLLPVMDSNNISVNYADRICSTLEMYIDTLKEEPISEDFEKEVEKMWAQESKCRDTDYTIAELTKQDYEDCARHFANWQKQKDVEVLLNHAKCIDESYKKGIKIGKAEMKQQLMAKAVDIEVKEDAGGYPYIPQMELYDYDKDIPLAREGDKFKVIFIKYE